MCMWFYACRTVKDTKNELLVVEVWDSDENKVGLSRVKGIMGLGT